MTAPRASHRATDPARATEWEAFHPHEAIDPIPAGGTVELDLNLLPSTTRFAAGDELVLELSDHWFFPANPITGQFPALCQRLPEHRWVLKTGTRIATLTIPTWN